MNRMRKIAIYAEIDLNIIDGSSIWLVSLAEMLLQDNNNSVKVIVYKSIKNKQLINPLLKYKNFHMVDNHPTGKLTQIGALQQIDLLFSKEKFDLLIVRGFNFSKFLVSNSNDLIRNKVWFYFTDFPTSQSNKDDIEQFKRILKFSNKILCQTNELLQYYKQKLNTNDNNFLLLPPLLPKIHTTSNTSILINNQIIYAGKLSPYWMMPNMIFAFNKIKDPKLKFLIIGNKFHNHPYKENYKEMVKKAFSSNTNIKWIESASREEVFRNIKESYIGISWRDSSLDHSMEISTKVLEYGLFHKPVILNRTKLHENLFGTDYPLYANSELEFIKKIKLAFDNKDIYNLVAERIHQVSLRHTFDSVYQKILPHIKGSSRGENQ
ncbi:hypothetical protein QTG56_17750 [Rossellomorea sp. AcN35-11]|nr:hypothetical protein QTG56_17750 [Rossellomorea sp. AcN35-11]